MHTYTSTIAQIPCGGQLMSNILLLCCDVANKSIYFAFCFCDKRFLKERREKKGKMLDLVTQLQLVALQSSQKGFKVKKFVFCCAVAEPTCNAHLASK